MRAARGLAVVLLVLVSAIALGACSGADSASTAPDSRTRTIHLVQTLHCAEGQVVERAAGSSLYACVNHSPAQPVSRAPDVQQGDRCQVFGATTYNSQGYVFDCEPWGQDRELRWILP